MALSLALMLGSAALTWLVISRLDGAGADTETSTSASQGERAAGESAGAVTAAPPTAAPPENADAVLAGALSDWVAATNSKDIEKQMSFYAPRLAVFYRRRNVSGGAVRREKARLFARAREVRMSASAPEITYGADALTATMRFRKSYTIESGRQTRRGEVVQELVWRKTPDGWKIVGERDVEVIR
jgi:ketosteroid isomerase-like protein